MGSMTGNGIGTNAYRGDHHYDFGGDSTMGQEPLEPDDEEGFYAPWSGVSRWYGASISCPTAEEKRAQDEAWLPLARFMARLPSLKDLVYTGGEQIPPCILETLHRDLPSCRLHVRTFRLRSLYHYANPTNIIDQDEYTLLTSPNLYSVCAHFDHAKADGQPDDSEDALQLMASRLPGLKHIYLFSFSPGFGFGLLRHSRAPDRTVYQTPEREWQGLFTDKNHPFAGTEGVPGHLHSLAFSARIRMCKARLESWSRYVDFSSLRSLTVFARLSLEALQLLSEMAEKEQFRSLRACTLHVDPIEVPVSEAGEKDFDTVTSKFLAAIPPLEALSIELCGMIDHTTFGVLLDRHNGLKRLELPMTRFKQYGPGPHCLTVEVSLNRIRALQQHCPDLEELNMTVPRSQGDAQEVAMYRALGTMRRLKRLKLDLDCSCPDDSSIVQGVDLELEGKLRFIRNSLFNGAIDSALAQSIFSLVFPPPTAGQPRYLAVLPRRVLDSEPRLWRLARWIGRKWAVSRHGQEIVAREIDKDQREWLLGGGDGLHLDHQKDFIGQTWNEIWPPTEGVGWRDGWSSCPLAV